MPSCVMPLTIPESELICELTWQNWGWLIHTLATGQPKDLELFVADPASWIERRAETAILCWGAVPVYLDSSTGKLAIQHNSLPAGAQLARQRQQREAGGSSSGHLPPLVVEMVPFGDASG
eukprot:8143962-Alexandrium_andersonii.AAC.1